MNTEQARLEAQRKGEGNWRLWGPYLSERAWGTVREDYSANGDAWNYFPHDSARSRTYRWGEDGMGGICDEQQRLCLALAMWNGKDPSLRRGPLGSTKVRPTTGKTSRNTSFIWMPPPATAI